MTHKLKDPGSAITHLIGMILAAIVSIPLIIKSFLSGDYVRIISLIIFTLSMVGLYGASTCLLYTSSSYAAFSQYNPISGYPSL